MRILECKICNKTEEYNNRGRIPVTCGSEECAREYKRQYHVAYRADHQSDYRERSRRHYWNTMKTDPENWSKYLEKMKKVRSKQYKKRSEVIPELTENMACAICSEIRLLVPDHDHRCHDRPGSMCEKCFRGYLCYNCNNGLGHLKDSIVILNNAIRYLEDHNIKRMEENCEEVCSF